jgi:DNA-binding NarL/FixJ family response regulator
VRASATSKGADFPGLAAHLGLIWLKGSQGMAFLDLERALSVASVAARIHKGVKAPLGDTPASVVICCPTGEEDIATEVSNILVQAPDATVLVFAAAPDLPLARAALRAGASGLLHSGMSSEQLLRAVSVALKGEVVLPRELLHQWIEEQRPPDLSVLSARQREILELVVEGLSNAEIARRLYLSESTIKQHLRAAYKALGVRSRKEAAGLLRKSIRSGYWPDERRERQRSSGSAAALAQRRC